MHTREYKFLTVGTCNHVHCTCTCTYTLLFDATSLSHVNFSEYKYCPMPCIFKYQSDKVAQHKSKGEYFSDENQLPQVEFEHTKILVNMHNIIEDMMYSTCIHVFNDMLHVYTLPHVHCPCMGHWNTGN